MKIGIDARMLGKMHGGIGRYVFEVAKNMLALDREDQFVIFFNQKQSDPAEVEELKKFVNATLVPANIRHYSVLEQLSFYRLLNKYELDVVHFPNFNVPMLYKKPFVVTIHDMVHHKISGHKKSHYPQFLAYKKIISSAAVNSKAIITVSESSKKDIARYLSINSEKIKVIYEGADVETKISPEQIAEIKKSFLLKRPYFIFVGVLERKKNLVSLTRGFDEFILKYNLDMDLVVVGKIDKHYPEIKHKALDIKASNRLVFCGEVSDTELEALYRGAYAFVSASLHEGFGLPGVEAMKFGLPLVVSNINSFNEIYDNAALYFNPLDPKDIAEKLFLIVRDQNFYKQIQNNSLLRSEFFDWRKTAEQTLTIYREAVL